MRRILLVLTVSTALSLIIGCGTTTGDSSSGSTVTSAPETTAAAVSPVASPSPDQITATSAVEKLKAAGLPISKVIVYTAKNDPNHLLGRPGGYDSKVAFWDSRLKGPDVADYDEGDVTRGGSTEVYASAAGAKARKRYIQECLKEYPMLGTEYDYVVGGVLLRLSQLLTPEQAKAYAAALSD